MMLKPSGKGWEFDYWKIMGFTLNALEWGDKTAQYNLDFHIDCLEEID